MPTVAALHADEAAIRYRVRITGVEDRALRRELRNVSVMRALSSRPPVSELQLRRRARRDPPLFEQVLRNHGFYGVKVETHIDMQRRRPRVHFEINTAPPYDLRNITLQSTIPDVAMPLASEIGLQTGTVAIASSILQANDEIIRILRTKGHAFAAVDAREVVVIHPEQAVDIHYEINPGNVYRFGETRIEGLRNVQEPFIRRKIPWQEGDPFDGRMLARVRRRLIAADLFGAVRIETGDSPPEDDLLPITAKLTERKHRSITLGMGYGSDEGWRARAGWVHRNFLQRGERLSVDYTISERGQIGELAFKRPDYRRVDQNLHLLLQYEIEDTRAFRSEKIGALARITRLHRDDRLYGIGLGLRYSAVENTEERQAYNLLYLPVTMEQDRSDDPLDPRSGNRLNLGVAPYWDTIDTDIFFVKPRVSFSAYAPLSRRNNLDWAGKITLASILGESRNRIPADERYYAGGGGSIRGYRYQTVGPMENRTPTGGRSLFLLSQELRWRWAETMGLVAFIDGGAVTEEAWFERTVDDLRWGTGLGFRYFTPVGPLRFDAAIPIRRREGIDDPWQFYISLGQAF